MDRASDAITRSKMGSQVGAADDFASRVSGHKTQSSLGGGLKSKVASVFSKRSSVNAMSNKGKS